MDKISTYWTIENENGRSVEVYITGYSSPFRKGDSVAAWHGPTPDEPAEFVMEEMFLVGMHQKLALPSEHRFWALVDIGDVEHEYFEPPW